MKSTGIVRKLDELGRIVIPIELRRNLGILEKDRVEIFVDEDKIIMQKYQSIRECVVTGEIRPDNIEVAGKLTLSQEGARILMKELEEYVKEPVGR